MPIVHELEFIAWEECAPQSLRGDPVWRFHTYRVALYLLDLAQADAAHLREHRRADEQLADQLFRAVASISANVGEGLGRPTSPDRSRRFSIALGSLRESVSWYRAANHALPLGTSDLRLEQLAELRRLLIGAQRWLAKQPPRARLV